MLPDGEPEDGSSRRELESVALLVSRLSLLERRY
jgi:hypothetical protein